jgi:hypothetical protein
MALRRSARNDFSACSFTLPRLELFPLPDRITGNWVRERYVATKSDIGARYAERKITGSPRLELDPRCSVVQSVAPAFDRAALSISGDRGEPNGEAKTAHRSEPSACALNETRGSAYDAVRIPCPLSPPLAARAWRVRELLDKGVLAARLRWSGRAAADRAAVAARSSHKRQSPHVLIAASDPLLSRRALNE